MNSNFSVGAGKPIRQWTSASSDTKSNYGQRKLTTIPLAKTKVSGHLQPRKTKEKKLQERSVEIVKISSRGAINKVSALLTPVIKRSQKTVAGAGVKELKKEMEALQGQLKHLEKKDKTLAKQLLDVRRKLHPPTHGPYKAAPPKKQDIPALRDQMDRINLQKNQVARDMQAGKALLANWSQSLRGVEAENQSNQLNDDVVESWSKLATGFRNAYQFHQKKGNAGKVAELDLGHLTFPGAESFGGVKLAVRRFERSSDGSIAIDFGRCSAEHIPEQQGGVAMDNLSVTIHSPLADHLHGLLSCNLLKLPSRLNSLRNLSDQSIDLTECIKVDASAMAMTGIQDLTSLSNEYPLRVLVENFLSH